MQNSRKVRVRIPATTANCGPGFDTLGIACTLYNEVELELSGPKDMVEIRVIGDGADSLPTNSRNLVLRSVKTLMERVAAEETGIRLTLFNSIPLSRGLGSSSAAIVGGLTAANALALQPLTQDKLLDIATELEGHPDNVAPALFGGFTISVMQGEQVACLRLPVPDQLKLVVCIPEFRLSTHKARQAIPAMVPHKDAVYNVSRAALLVGAMTSGNLDYLKHALHDKLHQPYRASLIPGMKAVFAAGLDAGALGVTISGAGPSLMAYVAGERSAAVGAAMVEAFASQQVESRYLCLNADAEGARVVDLA